MSKKLYSEPEWVKIGPKLWSVKMTFTSDAAFPIDMLRYDDCSPDSEVDSYEILRTLHEWREREPGSGELSHITVKKFMFEKRAPFTLDRWKSFGWTPFDSVKTLFGAREFSETKSKVPAFDFYDELEVNTGRKINGF